MTNAAAATRGAPQTTAPARVQGSKQRRWHAMLSGCATLHKEPSPFHCRKVTLLLLYLHLCLFIILWSFKQVAALIPCKPSFPERSVHAVTSCKAIRTWTALSITGWGETQQAPSADDMLLEWWPAFNQRLLCKVASFQSTAVEQGLQRQGTTAGGYSACFCCGIPTASACYSSAAGSCCRPAVIRERIAAKICRYCCVDAVRHSEMNVKHQLSSYSCPVSPGCPLGSTWDSRAGVQ